MKLLDNKYRLDMISQYHYGVHYCPKKNVVWSQTNLSCLFSKIYLILKGECKIVIGDEIITATPGTMVLIPENTMHSYNCDDTENFEKYGFHFNLDVNTKSFFDTITLPYSISIDGTDFSKAKKLLKDLISSANKTELSDCLLQHSLILQILSLYIAHTDCNIKTSRNSDKTNIELVLKFIQDNIDKKLTVKSLADFLHLDENYFISLFKKHTSYTPMQYIINLRMEKVKTYLRHTDLSIKEIMHKVGYTEANNFSRAFKRYSSKSPTEYREWYKKSDF